MSGVALLFVGLALGGGWNAWKTYWRWRAWRNKWRVIIDPSHDGKIDVWLARGAGSYANKTRIGSVATIAEDFQEKLDELRAVAETRARELNGEDAELRAS